MLPHVHQSRHFHPNRAGETAATEALEHRSDAGHPGNCLSPVLPAARPAVGKAKVKSIKMVDRLQPSELQRVSLPFKEVGVERGKREENITHIIVLFGVRLSCGEDYVVGLSRSYGIL